MHQHRLPFWSFFHEIERTLSYERWIDKYKLFIEALLNRHIPYDKHYRHFIQFCKVLYLQDPRDEEKFESLLYNAIDREKNWLQTVLEAGSTEAAIKEPAQDKQEPPEGGKDDPLPEPAVPPQVRNRQAEEEETRQPGITPETSAVYYNLPFEPAGNSNQAANSSPSRPINFLLTDEYFPITRRQMVKAWQFLRRKEKGSKENGIDLPATIARIARDGLFLEPKYKTGLQNREDAIVIFADYRGSMTAFHELTNRLIKTAKGEGGHPRAPVFYFHNYPVGYVYKRSNLTEPVKIKEALLKANRNFTLAVVISDAGAARVNSSPEEKNTRAQMTDFLLTHLNDACAHTIWLNPMPYHRWQGTAAESIREKVFLMAPVFEQGSYNFQDTLRTILKQNLKNEKTIM